MTDTREITARYKGKSPSTENIPTDAFTAVFFTAGFFQRSGIKRKLKKYLLINYISNKKIIYYFMY